MTSETRTTIQLSDFRAVEIECVACHYRIVRPIGPWNSFLFSCPECGANWAHFRGSMEFLTQMASQIAKVSQIDSPDNQTPFIVRFEINTDKKP
jgi:hypothetical protein